MKKNQITAKFKIHSGKVDVLKKIAAYYVVAVAKNENGYGALQYDWFFNTDQAEYAVREAYTDSNALLEHMGNQGDQLGQLFALADMSAEIYGNPSLEIRHLIASLPMKVYSFYQGL